MVSINTVYLQSNRGIIKILELVAAIVVCSLLCFNARGCFGDYRVTFPTGLNSIVLVINIIVLILNFVDAGIYRLERLYTIIACVLFLVASVFMVWYVIEYPPHGSWELTAAVVLIIVQFLLFLWDVRILQGDAPNYVNP